METFLLTVNRIFDLIFFMGGYEGRYAAIVFIGAVSALVFLIIFKITSNQEGIRREKNRIIGNLFQIRLYKDDLLLILSSIFQIFTHNLSYLRYMLAPLLFTIIPLVIFTVEVNQRCGYQPLRAGSEFIISADLSGKHLLDTIKCETSSGIALLTPVMRVYDQAKAFWRAKIIRQAGTQETVALYINGREAAAKTVVMDTPARRFIPEKIKADSLNAILYHAEGFLPVDSPVERLTVAYPRASYNFLGIGMDAVVLYFIFTLLFALAVKPLFRVTI